MEDKPVLSMLAESMPAQDKLTEDMSAQGKLVEDKPEVDKPALSMLVESMPVQDKGKLHQMEADSPAVIVIDYVCMIEKLGNGEWLRIGMDPLRECSGPWKA